jgi:DNA-binding HxlR family transcriptional regulator
VDDADGLVSRTVFPVIPPRVEYELTNLGKGPGTAFCGVWIWAERHREAIMRARKTFQQRSDFNFDHAETSRRRDVGNADLRQAV